MHLRAWPRYLVTTWPTGNTARIAVSDSDGYARFGDSAQTRELLTLLEPSRLGLPQLASLHRNQTTWARQIADPRMTKEANLIVSVRERTLKQNCWLASAVHRQNGSQKHWPLVFATAEKLVQPPGGSPHVTLLYTISKIIANSTWP